ncbi:MAG: NUDIX hydrolase [Gammaproteobacteria bacterium]|nr:NUDIX hydrolase [Gammaproteobacteria bacterium]MDH4255234.1 NUDIX hydrolase [Gammaproteobacteria bacterium]MDH5310045.1 NUDIX hydrolase [Gammaproteobacteria bacterium]
MPYTYDHPHPAVTVDIVLFTLRGGHFEVLLIRRAQPPYEGLWALPGGFVAIDESLRRAAWRELKEETGVNAVYLEQLYTFGRPDRDPRERVISVAYLALLPPGTARVTADSDAAEADWWPANDLPALAFDHERIVAKAIGRLRGRLGYSSMALQLMPAEFTLPELQAAYEAILGEPQDRRNFRKKILSLDIVEPTGQTSRRGAHRPARLYRACDRNVRYW